MSQAESYGNTHRAFLQALIARPTLTFAEAKPLLALIQTQQDPSRPVPDEDITREEFGQYVHAVNSAISPFDLEIRRTLDQSNRGAEVFALVNTTSDALAQMATVHTADEIAFVKRVLDCMFETNNTRRAEVMAVTGQQALNLAKAPSDGNRRASGAATQESHTQEAAGTSQQQNASLTMAQAEKTLRLLVSESWFEQSDRGFYSLAPRSLMELRGWLVDTYNDREHDDSDVSDEGHPHVKIKVCLACQEIVTQGQRCPDPALRCPGRLHAHCVGKLWRAQGGREICPECKKEWKDPLPVGEKAARRTRQSGSMGGRRSGGAGMDGADDSD